MCVKHLNPRQGITTRSPWLLLAAAGAAACETPKSPPGDYNHGSGEPQVARGDAGRCETPKSPPGDYNSSHTTSRQPGGSSRCVKHLNPRQGITRLAGCGGGAGRQGAPRVKHLNPRQGITSVVRHGAEPADDPAQRVKHLNPRQGITSQPHPARPSAAG